MEKKKKELKVIATSIIYENGESVMKNKYGRVITGISKLSKEFMDYVKKTEGWEKDIIE